MKKSFLIILNLLFVYFFSSITAFAAPAPITAAELIAIDIEDGISLSLDWTQYNETEQENLATYNIYAETTTFTNIENLTPAQTIAAGTQTCILNNLEHNGTYYIAVIPIDTDGNSDTETEPLATITLNDTKPPEQISNLQVTSCKKTELSFSFTPSANTSNDLSNYIVEFNNNTETLDPTESTFLANNLSPATQYEISITAIDNSGNKKEPVTIDCATLLANPTNIKTKASYGSVNLTWNNVTPSEALDHYAVYVSESPFTNTSNLASSTRVKEPTATIYKLKNNTQYYFAVTAVNISDGETEEVTNVTSTPLTATMVSGNITSDTTWTLANSPYVVTGNVFVYGSASPTLTIEPGVEVRFDPGTILQVNTNRYNWKESLIAVGTKDHPITFTSNAATPAPGDWQGIYFGNYSDDSKTRLEHCKIEYGGNSTNANIYCYYSRASCKNIEY